MDEMLRALVLAGIIDQDTADVMRRRLDPDEFRAWADAEIERATQAGLTAQQGRVVDFIRQNDYHPTDRRWAGFWAREDALMWDTLRTAFTRVGTERQAAARATIATSDLTFDLPNLDAREWVSGYYTSPNPLDHGSVPNLDQTSREQVRDAFRRWINGDLEGAAAREEGLPALIRELETTFGPERARRIAVTESTRIFTEGQRQAEADNETVVYFRCMTSRDESVCFPGFTTVTTPSGDVAIQDIKVGDYVLTRNGPRQVKATSKRNYSGAMVTVYAGDRAVTSTANHPYWTVEKGWLEGYNLTTGYTLQNVLNENMNINSILNFNVGHSANHPTVSHEIVGLSGVSSIITVPVDTIDFKRHESSESSIIVYDIQVEEVPEFYANGLLVHNCPVCGPLDGQTREKGVYTYNHPELGAIAGPPFHVNCRCGEAPETSLTVREPLIRQWQFTGAVT